MDNNLNALMDAANQKLDAQKKQAEMSSSEDLYADMKQEMEQDDEQNIDIKRQEYNYPQEEYDIHYCVGTQCIKCRRTKDKRYQKSQSDIDNDDAQSVE